MKINKQIIKGGKQQFADKIINGSEPIIEKDKIYPDKEKVKSIISKGDLSTAINSLLEINVNTEIEKELLLMKSKVTTLSKNKNLDLATYENNSITESKIILALLDVIEKI